MAAACGGCMTHWRRCAVERGGLGERLVRRGLEDHAVREERVGLQRAASGNGSRACRPEELEEQKHRGIVGLLRTRCRAGGAGLHA